MTRPLRFVATFLAAFALLIALSAATAAPARYAAGLERATGLVSPLVNGWWLDTRPGPQGPELWLRRGDQQQRMPFDLKKFADAIFPLLSLLAATPGLGLKRCALSAAAGIAAVFLLDLTLLLLFPILVRPGALTDIAGTFLGLIVFVGAPPILWFVLTFDRLRGVWRLGSHEHRGS